MSTKNQPSVTPDNLNLRADAADYISDPEYISKIINQFILKDDTGLSGSAASKPISKDQH